MKRWLILCIFLFVTFGCSPTVKCSDDPACLRILFIGNSYTFVNDLPGTFAKLANSGNHRVETGMATQGGWFLSDHVKSAETLNQISSQKWNIVVLQEQSQTPAREQVRDAQMYPAIRTLVSYIVNNGAQPMLFITWAHRDGWPENGMSTYESMQLAIDEGYTKIGHELSSQMAPVGYAWLKLRQQNPQLNLWQEDGSHPNEQGTYLAACVFYAMIYRDSPEELSYMGNLSKADALLLQKTAADIVLNNPTYWNIPK